MFRRIMHHPQGGLSSIVQKYLLIVMLTLVTKRKIYYVWVLQRYLQLLEQYIIPVIVGWFVGCKLKQDSKWYS
jgi:hypothetical protein